MSDEPLDPLYRRPLGDFIAARNQLAKKLKTSGDKELSTRVKALQRPSLVAWTINQLYWREREGFDRLIACGDEVRAMQSQSLAESVSGAEINQATRERREAERELLEKAKALVMEGGQKPSDAMLRRLADSLEAIAIYGSSSLAPRAGRLEREVERPSFEALEALQAEPPPPLRRKPVVEKTRAQTLSKKTPPKPEPDPGIIQKLRSVVEDLEQRLARAERSRQAAGKRIEVRKSVVHEKEQELARAREQLDSQLGELDEAVSDIERTAKELAARQQELSKQTKK